MITEKINEKELLFCQNWHTPVCMTESLFSCLDNLSEFKDTLSDLRMYQYPMLSSEPFIDFEVPGLTPKERFELRKGAGDLYNYGGRKFGKSLITEKIDICLSMLHDANCWCGFSSADAIHLQDILDVVTRGVSFHPILHMWKRRFRMSPKYEMEAKSGWLLQGINMNVASKDAGRQWFGKHVRKLWIEEASLETDKAYDKRKDSLSELGAVLRISGMTNFTRFTPAGKSFYDPENRNKIMNLPQSVNPTFDDKEDKNRQKEYGGADSLNYRIFVDGEVCEDGISEFDIARIEPYINSKVDLKIFEVKKEAFSYFKNIIIVERPKNVERIFIASDIGDGAGGSELVVLGEIGDKYHYLYRIALYSLKDDEQFEVFDWLIQKLQANVIGLDCGDGTGRAIYRRLEKKYPKTSLVYYSGAEKIGVDWKKDDNGKVLLENGKPTPLDEFMSEWSVRHLKALLYEGRILMPTDFKLEKQINSVIARTVGSRTVYACVSEDGDHVFDAMKVFSICVWLKKDFNSTPKLATEMGIGVSSWSKQTRMNIDKNKWRLMFEKREELVISKEDYNNGLRQFLLNETVKFSLENQPEVLKYIQNEIQKLDKLHIGE
jgi:hypothetical protein